MWQKDKVHIALFRSGFCLKKVRSIQNLLCANIEQKVRNCDPFSELHQASMFTNKRKNFAIERCAFLYICVCVCVHVPRSVSGIQKFIIIARNL